MADMTPQSAIFALRMFCSRRTVLGERKSVGEAVGFPFSEGWEAVSFPYS